LKHPIYSIRPKMMFGSVLVLAFGMWKLQNLCLSLNALFRGTKVMKHPF
jgi:hypothetical protein